MKMSVMCPKRPLNLSLSQAFTCQTLLPQENQQEKERAATFQLSSGLIWHKLEPLQMSSQSRVTLKIEPQQRIVPIITPFKVQKPQEVSTAMRQSLIKIKDMRTIGTQVTLANFEKHLRNLWVKDPTLSLDQLFEISKKLFNLIDERQRQLVNLTRKWCNRFLKTLKGMPSGEFKDKDKQEMIQDTYEVFSQPESAQMEVKVHNTSEQWREHTLKLLLSKYPGQIDCKRKQGEKAAKSQVWIFNEAMAKTVENKRLEILRLQEEFQLSEKQFMLQRKQKNQSQEKQKRVLLPDHDCK